MQKNKTKKKCPRCKQFKKAVDFYSIKNRYDGLSGYCRMCMKDIRSETKEYNQKYYFLNRKKILLQRKESNKRGVNYGVSKADYHRNYYHKKMSTDVGFRERVKKNSYASRSRYPQRYKARQMLNYAIALGKIKIGKCEVCGEDRVNGHHPDYSKPLEVRWLCSIHHARLHRELRKNNMMSSFQINKLEG